MIVSIICAMAEGDRGIGYRGGLPWHLPADLARFKRLTLGHALILGRLTYQSLGGRQLPGRRLIVVTRRGGLEATEGDILTAGSVEQALELAGQEGEEEAFIGGGAQIYRHALERGLAQRMYLTIVHGEFPADTFFPEYRADVWKAVSRVHRPPDQANPQAMTFLDLELAAER